MLNIGKLMLAGAEASKNQLFHGVLNEIRDYNSISAGNKKVRIAQLMRACQVAGWYVTSKPPQPGKSKNRRRWEAVNNLLQEAYVEAADLGVKLLSGPADFKTISGAHANQSYWLEFLDPQHRPGYVLSPQYAAWLANAGAVAAKQSFWDCIGTTFNPSSLDVIVKYYPEDPHYSDADTLVHFEGGRLLDTHNDPYHTAPKKTHFSGDGWAIFVISPDGRFFSGSHLAGVHHHSSFLGGGAVMAAGEIVVDQGVIKIITAKSGHYKPSADNLLAMVRRFGEIPGDAIIQADLAGPVAKFHTVAAFRSQGKAAPVLTRTDILARLPLFAASRNDPGGGSGFYTTWKKAPIA